MSNDEEEEEFLIKKTKGLKIKHPKNKGKKKMKDKKKDSSL